MPLLVGGGGGGKGEWQKGGADGMQHVNVA